MRIGNMKGYMVMLSWEGIDDTYEDEFDGVVYSSRAEARKVLIDAKNNDIEGNLYYIKEVE